MLSHQLGHAFVHIAGQLCAKRGFSKIVILKRRRRDSLNVNTHAVHVLNAHRHIRQHRRSVAHLFGVGVACELVGKDVSDFLLNWF